MTIATKSRVEELRCSRLSNIFNYNHKLTEDLILIKSRTHFTDAIDTHINVNLKTYQL